MFAAKSEPRTASPHKRERTPLSSLLPYLRDRIFDWRNKLLADPQFHAWAARAPFINKITKKEANSAFDLCAGFVYSQILLACVKLSVFDVLAAGALGVPAIASAIGLSPDATLRLMKAAAALRLVEARSGGRFGLGMVGAAIRANPGVVAMIRHHEILYHDLQDPVALLKGTAPPAALSHFWGYAEGGGAALSSDSVAGYTNLMGASNAFVADQVLAAYPLDRHKVLLDVGGGNATFVSRVAQKYPQLDLKIFDLPAVADQARTRLMPAPYQNRITVHAGDFFADPLPAGADLITLLRIIHDHDDEPVRKLLRAARGALCPGGTLLIAEPMSGTAGAAAIGDAYFGFYLMAMGSGSPRTPEAITALLKEAGFHSIREVRTLLPMQSRLIVAQA